jgi:hypothetical protein
MKKNLFWSLSLLLVMTAGHLSAQIHKLAPMVHAFAWQQVEAARRAGGQVSQKPALFVVRLHPEADPGEASQQIEATGAEVKTAIGRMLMVAATARQLQDVAALEDVQLIEKPVRSMLKLDNSRKATHADEVQTGTGVQLPQAYQGDGVIIGFIDVGFDVTQPAFKDEQGNLRVKAAYYPGMTNGKGHKAVVDGKELEGTLFDTAELMLDTTRLKDNSEMHGTHVAGCAAASAISTVKGITGGSLAGMAPKAELIFCNTSPDDAQQKKYEGTDDDAEQLNTMYALNYMADYAKKAGKPFMVTMSMNTHNGTHDGTSAGSQIFKAFCDKGHVMTISTGNEGKDNCHIHKTVDGEHPLKTLMGVRGQFAFYNYLFTDKPTYIRFFVYDEDKKQELATTAVHELKNGLSSKVLKVGDTEDVGTDALSQDLKTLLQDRYTSAGGGLVIGNGIGAGIAPDGSSRAMTQTVMQSKGKFNFLQQKLGIEITSSVAVEQRAWIDNGEFLNAEGFDVAGNDVSVGDYNTTGVPIGVGAWTASNLIVDKPGEAAKPDEDFKVGEVAPFSSYGTDYAGNRHPFVVSPGVCIYSTANSFYGDGTYETSEVSNRQSFSNQFIGQTTPREYCWVKADGTSMATPIAAGIIALWLQAAHDKGRTLSNDDVKVIIQKSVDTDDNTTKAGIRAGYGKINAYKGILEVLDLPTTIPSLSKNQPAAVTFRLVGDVLYADGAADGTPVIIYSLSGTVLQQTTVQQGSIVLNGLQRGVYAVQLGQLGSTLIRK